MFFQLESRNRRGCTPVKRHNLSVARHGAEDRARKPTTEATSPR